MKRLHMSVGITLLAACSSSEPADAGDTLLRETGAATMSPSSTGTGMAGMAGSLSASPQTSGAPTATSMTTPTAGMSPSAAAGGAAPSSSVDSAAGGMGAMGMQEAGAAAAGNAAAMPPSAGSTAQGAAGAEAEQEPASSGPSMGTVTISFATESYGGFYAPRNYGAVWFETPDGQFIKTAKRWAGRHAGDLSTWTSASGGWPSLLGGGNMADMADAVSTATLNSHEMHTVMWEAKGADSMLVPDGEYVAVVEVTEDRAATPGPVLRVPFTKGPEPQMVDVPDETSFKGITLSWAPN